MRSLMLPPLLALLILTSVSSASAEYNFSSWTADDGLPQNSVYAIAQTRDGYLWFTTLDGLVRFDGVSFTNFSKSNVSQFKSNRFSSLLEDSRGDLWMGTDDGGVVRYRGGEFFSYTTDNGLPHNAIDRLLKGPDGLPIVVTRAGMVHWHGDRFVSFVPPKELIYRRFSGALSTPGNGIFWYADGAEIISFREGQLLTSQKYQGLSVAEIYEDSQHSVWLGTVNGGLVKFKDGEFTTYGSKNGLPSLTVTSLFEDRDGKLWVGTRAGLCAFQEEKATCYNTSQGLSGDYIRSINQDREGNLWIGTDNRGLNRLTPRAVNFYTAKDGLLSEITYPIIQDRSGTVWIGGRDGSLTRYQNGIFNGGFRPNGGPFESTTALAEDGEGRLWIGKLASIQFLKDGRLNTFDPGMPLAGVIIRAIHEDRTGTIWFATSIGLLKHQNGVTSLLTTRDGLPGNDVEALLEDAQGRLWLGTYSGLSVYQGGSFSSFTEKDGLPSNHLRSLYEDADGVIWIGTYDGGLARFKDGHFTSYNVNNGLYNNGVFAILEDAKNNLWLSCNRGIYRVSRQQLNDYAAGKTPQIDSVAYGKQDGLLNIECNGGRQPAGFKTRDGRLWFPTQGGVAVIDPETVSINPQSPRVVIENCLVQRQSVGCQLPMEIGPGQENIEIHYTGLSFIKSEQVRFRYQLEGLDESWIDTGVRRVAYFSHLPPGKYTFKVIAANSDGIWNTEGAVLRIIVLPPFWRTWWFVSLIGLTVAGLGFAVYTFRVRQLRAAHAVQEAFSRQLIQSQELERKRIAAELHDSLGQNLLVIKNRALLGLTAEQPAAKEQLDKISSSASQAIEEVREIAYNLRPYHLDRLGLTSTIEAMVEKVAASTEIEFTAQIAPIDNLFTKEDEIGIYRVIQECVSNVVRHSRATDAQVLVSRSDHYVQIIVKDNGRGFNPAERMAAKRGFGLTGIAERTKMLGGTVSVQSTPENGTKIEVRLEVPSGEDE